MICECKRRPPGAPKVAGISLMSASILSGKHLVLKGLEVPVSAPLSTGRGIHKKEEPPTGGGDGGFGNSVSIFAATNRNLMLF